MQLELNDRAGGIDVVPGEFAGHHSPGLEPESVTIEGQGLVEIGHREGDHVNAGIHRRLLTLLGLDVDRTA